MFTAFTRAAALTGLALVIAGCESSAHWTSIFRTADLDSGVTLITDAKQRVVINVPALGGPGQNTPTRIVCAEPSPDVAQALSDSISAAIKVEIAGKGGGSAAFGRSTAESVAQLGERLGTIQLLRDGLYRACEAYANGAINSTTYAMIVSRYDNTMVTLLMGELAAGAFGRSGALISAAASGAARAGGGGGSEAALDNLTAKQNVLNTAQEKVDNEQADLTAMEAAADKDNNRDEAEKKKISGQEKNLKSVEKARGKAKEERDQAYDLFVSTLGSAGITTRAEGRGVHPMGAIETAKETAAAAGAVLQAMHKNFLDNDERDISPLIKACVTTLDRSKSQIQIPWEDSKELVKLAVDVHKANEKVIRLEKKRQNPAAAEAELKMAKKKYLDKQTKVTNKLSTSRLTHLGLVCQTQIMPQVAAIISAAPDLAKARLARDQALAEAEKAKSDLNKAKTMEKVAKDVKKAAKKATGGAEKAQKAASAANPRAKIDLCLKGFDATKPNAVDALKKCLDNI